MKRTVIGAANGFEGLLPHESTSGGRSVGALDGRASRQDLDIRPILKRDIEQLGVLLYEAYKGAIDEQEKDVADALVPLKEILQSHASGGETSRRFVAASILTFWKERPLLAQILTLPECQGRGLARKLTEMSIQALAERDHPELFLVVTEGNPAQRLYEKMGFKYHAPAKPVAPPPNSKR